MALLNARVYDWAPWFWILAEDVRMEKFARPRKSCNTNSTSHEWDVLKRPSHLWILRIYKQLFYMIFGPPTPSIPLRSIWTWILYVLIHIKADENLKKSYHKSGDRGVPFAQLNSLGPKWIKKNFGEFLDPLQHRRCDVQCGNSCREGSQYHFFQRLCTTCQNISIFQ